MPIFKVAYQMICRVTEVTPCSYPPHGNHPRASRLGSGVQVSASFQIFSTGISPAGGGGGVISLGVCLMVSFCSFDNN